MELHEGEGVAAANAQDLLSPTFLGKLERLALVSRRVRAGLGKGERRSTRRGASVEFADYRDYTTGDDLRRVDWNTFARLERLFLKLFVEEEEITVHLLLDASRSMAFGEPTKFAYAQRVSAALGYLGLAGFDQVTAAVFTDSGARIFPAARGRAQTIRLFRFLAETRAEGAVDLGRSLRDYALTTRRPGLALLLSDCLHPDWQDGLKALAARGFDASVLHILDPCEAEPTLVGDLRLVDCETGETREVSVSQSLLARYQQMLAEFCEGIAGACTRYGMGYARVTTEVPFEDLVLRVLRARGIVR